LSALLPAAIPNPLCSIGFAKTGHTIEEPVPSLFTFNMPGNEITALMGVSVEKAAVKVMGTKLAEEGPYSLRIGE
jgi:predicted flavoprotein YhiN